MVDAFVGEQAFKPKTFLPVSQILSNFCVWGADSADADRRHIISRPLMSRHVLESVLAEVRVCLGKMDSVPSRLGSSSINRL